ncbi:MAG: Hint domain-containing protein, partial [Paracoccaceae bacterium]|nr:Hint domain-containing protein [Paracoccaceae bacterium]
NGVVIGTTSLNNQGSSTAGVTGTFQIGVDASGNVSASWGNFSVNATIPSDQWATTSQSNFNFNIAGRTGGNAGTAYIDNVQLNATVVCFARGTLIETETGPRPVEDLRTGDRILTVDNGYQPIRWIGCSHVPAQGRLAPIRINTGALGNTRPLIVSPHHRILIGGWRAELLFGVPEVLVAAKALVNDHSILRQEGGYIDYFHILFDQHELIYAEGAVAESLFLGAQSLSALSDEARDEIETLFPELRQTGQVAHFIAARRVLTTTETRALHARAA